MIWSLVLTFVADLVQVNIPGCSIKAPRRALRRVSRFWVGIRVSTLQLFDFDEAARPVGQGGERSRERPRGPPRRVRVNSDCCI